MRDSIELLQATFREAPEALNAIDMCCVADKLVLAMIDSQMFAITDIHQAVIAAPAITIDDGIKAHATTNNGLQGGLFAIGDDFCINAAITFEDAEDDSFATGSTTALAAHSARSKIRFINFDLASGEGRGSLAGLCQALSDFQIDRVDTLTR